MEPISEDETPSDGTVFVLRNPGPSASARRSAGTGEFAAGATDGTDEFIEDEQPSSGDPVHEGTPKVLDATRRTLAVGMLWLVAVMAVMPTLALVLTHWTHFKTDDYRELSLVFTPVVALTSAAFGFFFASDERHRSS
ncbi:hypothetical protein ABZX38_20915 [Streptomyces longwoodensis]|uniref:hypothetical protein n=1 Tax=Streptomyces longwoodensis TaxID=68231 RepID=UPI0033AA1D79